MAWLVSGSTGFSFPNKKKQKKNCWRPQVALAAMSLGIARRCVEEMNRRGGDSRGEVCHHEVTAVCMEEVKRCELIDLTPPFGDMSLLFGELKQANLLDIEKEVHQW